MSVLGILFHLPQCFEVPLFIDAVGPAVWCVPGQGDEGPTAVGSTRKCQKG